MTEQEWHDYADRMYIPSARKQRLFLCAICRRILHFTPDKRGHKAIQVAERYADGMASLDDLRKAVCDVRAASLEAVKAIADAARVEGLEVQDWMEAARQSGKINPLVAALSASVVYELPLWQRGDASQITNLTHLALVNSADALFFGELRREGDAVHDQKAILRDIQPPSTVRLEPAFLAQTVISLAQAIYAEGAFDRLPILADALEDSGCTNQEILAHCRGPGAHLRGCWAVDLLLGKE